MMVLTPSTPDPDATTFHQASLVVSVAFAQPGDVLSVANVGTGPGQISIGDDCVLVIACQLQRVDQEALL